VKCKRQESLPFLKYLNQNYLTINQGITIKEKKNWNNLKKKGKEEKVCFLTEKNKKVQQETDQKE
jgi:hypothetical protein